MTLPSAQTESFGFLLLPGHPMLPVSAAIDVLALANYVSGEPIYSWCTIGHRIHSARSMNGLNVQTDHLIEDAPPLINLVVGAGVDGHKQTSTEVSTWLRRLKAGGTSIGAVSTGSWVLAKAGLLEGKRCTIHWEDRAAFRETYPELEVTEAIFETDGPISTCSGGTAVVDLSLTFVAAAHGIDLANKVAEQVLHSETRSPSRTRALNQQLCSQRRTDHGARHRKPDAIAGHRRTSGIIAATSGPPVSHPSGAQPKAALSGMPVAANAIIGSPN
nr:AraC family transcriptional regulator [Roseovarius albus]